MLTPKLGTDFYLNCGRSSSNRKIMLFELCIGGHYAAYIQHLVRYWREQELQGHLDVVVSPKFIQQHSDIVDIALGGKQRNINFVAITPEEHAVLPPRKSSAHRAWRAFQEWSLLCKYATALRTTQCLLMYLDTFQSPLALGLRTPCLVSGIYFRPTFHYSDFAAGVFSRKERVQQWREKLVLPRVLRHPNLQTLFCLDPFAVKHLDKIHSKVKAVPLPDPVQIYNHPEHRSGELKESLGIDPGRQVFLFFGLIDGRKGIHQLLEAILMLPPTLCQKLCLLLVGPVDSQDKSLVQTRLAEISQSLPIQIISCDRYIPDQEIQPYLQLADVVLAPYQRHAGMSSILVRAAAAQKPVLSSNYGLTGEITRSRGLGLTVDSTVPSEIAKGLTRFMLESSAEFCDRENMIFFADQNSAENFASVIFQYI